MAQGEKELLYDSVDKYEVVKESIRNLLNSRSPGASICPSEAVRCSFPDSWRNEMEVVKAVARKMVLDGELEITQKGRAICADVVRGPYRLRFRQSLG